MKESKTITIPLTASERRVVQRLHKRDGLSVEAIIRLCIKFGLPLVEATLKNKGSEVRSLD